MKSQKSNLPASPAGRKSQKFFLVIFLAGLLVFPLASQAAGLYKVYENGDEKTVCYEGLVPCGKPVYVGSSINTEGKCEGGDLKEVLCKFCHLPIVVLTIINFFLLPPTGIVFIVAVLMLTVGGALIIFSGGNPGRVARGRTILTATIIGLVIIYTAWIVVNEFLVMIDVSENFPALQPGKWNEVMFNCPIRLPK